MKKSPVLAGCVPCAKCRGAGEKRRTEFDVLGPFMQGLRNFKGPQWLPQVCRLCSTNFEMQQIMSSSTDWGFAFPHGTCSPCARIW